jgi:hypothetical protein
MSLRLPDFVPPERLLFSIIYSFNNRGA